MCLGLVACPTHLLLLLVLLLLLLLQTCQRCRLWVRSCGQMLG
jgi:hypothetical protein